MAEETLIMRYGRYLIRHVVQKRAGIRRPRPKERRPHLLFVRDGPKCGG